MAWRANTRERLGEVESLCTVKLPGGLFNCRPQEGGGGGLIEGGGAYFKS